MVAATGLLEADSDQGAGGWSIGALLNSWQAAIASTRAHKTHATLQGDFGPIQHEVYERACQVVEGALPLELDGVFMRNGSNPYFDPAAGYHWLDGDGMVHAMRIKDGTASYCNHWIRTHKLQEELRMQGPSYLKVGDLEGVTGVLVMLLEMLKYLVGVNRALSSLPLDQGKNTANTSLLFHAGRLLALHECNMPYQLKVTCDGLLETVGRLTLDDWSTPFTAHPKLDASTGSLHFFGYQFERKPYLAYGVMDSTGRMLKHLDIDVPYPALLHDFTITQNYAVLMHMPLVLDPLHMVMNDALPLVFKPHLPVRVGLLPLTARRGDEIVWFELPAFYCFHFANAWEDEDGVVKVYGCKLTDVNLAPGPAQNLMGDSEGPRMTKFTFNPHTGHADMREVSQLFCEFPVVHPALQGKKSRYAYVATAESMETADRLKGFAKLDLWSPSTQQECAVAEINYANCGSGGEPLFVPCSQDPTACAGEDDGFICVYVTEADGHSYLHIYDAATMDPTPLAKVKMPQRVPLGFHATWMAADQIHQQVLHSQANSNSSFVVNPTHDIHTAPLVAPTPTPRSVAARPARLAAGKVAAVPARPCASQTTARVCGRGGAAVHCRRSSGVLGRRSMGLARMSRLL